MDWENTGREPNLYGKGESVRGSAYMYVAVVFVWSGEREKIRDGEKKGKKAGRKIKRGDCLFV